jgi:hypothetical protein
MTVFIGLVETAADDKPEVLRSAVTSILEGRPPDIGSRSQWCDRDPRDFVMVPGSPFAYWASSAVISCYQRLRPLERQEIHAGAGAQTRDNFRFIRASWEVSEQSIGRGHGWVPLAKGGSFARYYYDVHLLVRWAEDGRELKSATSAWRASKGWGDYWRAAINSADYYFRAGLTWPARTTSGFSIRCMPAGCVFGHKGPSVFVPLDEREALLSLVALLNSAPFSTVVAVQLAAVDAAARSYEVGVIQNAPIPELRDAPKAALATLGRRAWSLTRCLDAVNETSHAFLLPPGLNEKVTGVDRAALEREMEAIQKRIDEAAIMLFGIVPEDRPAVEAFSKRSASSASSEPKDPEDDGEAAENELPVGGEEEALTSWLVGVVFGRFDPRLATGERPIPAEPEPFDPLTPRTPGMWPKEEAVPRTADILVDDEGHADDLGARVRAMADRVHVEAPQNLRNWLAKEFFPLHIKIYSKSRRKAPIYWQLATPSASYSVWIYIHAFNKDTLFRVQNDYVLPKLAHEERRLNSLTIELRDIATAPERRELATQEAFVEELRAFLEEVKRVAPLWNPSLDDGVVINFAPLWRLVPQHKSWQNELKSIWDALCEGAYDWAHVAMHLWPERVVPQCATDCSLAITHGLEDHFWTESDSGKWKPRLKPKRPVDELVRERTSIAVKTALKGLTEASPPNGPKTRKRRTSA